MSTFSRLWLEKRKFGFIRPKRQRTAQLDEISMLTFDRNIKGLLFCLFSFFSSGYDGIKILFSLLMLEKFGTRWKKLVLDNVYFVFLHPFVTGFSSDTSYDNAVKCQKLGKDERVQQFLDECDTDVSPFVCKKRPSVSTTSEISKNTVASHTSSIRSKPTVSCEKGWKLSTHSQKCFKLFDKSYTWNEAELFCLHNNAHLCSIHSDKENKFYAG